MATPQYKDYYQTLGVARTATEKEIIDFGKKHRDCNIRILAG